MNQIIGRRLGTYSQNWNFLHRENMRKTMSPVFEKIIMHPFNQELSQGTLSFDKFIFYLKQDQIFLDSYLKALKLLKIRVRHTQAENEVNHRIEKVEKSELALHKHYLRNDSSSVSYCTESSKKYARYLIDVCKNHHEAVALAALLPCPWVYLEVASKFLTTSHVENPYYKWIEYYSRPHFRSDVEKSIKICEAMACKANDAILRDMLDALTTSSELELAFWDDAYNFNCSLDNMH